MDLYQPCTSHILSLQRGKKDQENQQRKLTESLSPTRVCLQHSIRSTRSDLPVHFKVLNNFPDNTQN